MLESPPTVNSRTCGISYQDTALISPVIPEQVSTSCHHPRYSASGVSGAAPEGSGSVIVTHDDMTKRRYANLRITFGASISPINYVRPRSRLGDIRIRSSDRESHRAAFNRKYLWDHD